MQIHNVNLPITVTGRHVSVTEAMRDYAYKKVENLHLDYPRIIDAKVILDVENKERQKAEIGGAIKLLAELRKKVRYCEEVSSST